MRRYFRNFIERTDGAITVDWVVLTAGAVAVAIFVLSPYGLAPLKLGQNVSDELGTVTERFFAPAD
jgi:hypothetical protein